METIGEKININLRIGNQIYPISILREEEELYRRVGELVNGKLNNYASVYPNQGTERYLMMTLLDISLRLLRNEKRNDTTPYLQTMAQLQEEIENVLPKV